jgi:hypothetical protein
MTTTSATAPKSRYWLPIEGLSDVWELRASDGAFPLRTVAVRLAEGRVAVYSPIRHAAPAALDELADIGKPILIAPNAYHTLGLAGHAQRFDDAPIVTSDRAYARIRTKTKLAGQPLRLLQAYLPSNVTVLTVPDVRNGEVWLSIEQGGTRAWVVCDTFLNMTKKLPGLYGIAMSLMQAGPGLAISSTFKFLVEDRAFYRDWVLEQIERERPTMLIPCHGKIIRDESLPQQLEALVKRRFRTFRRKKKRQ